MALQTTWNDIYAAAEGDAVPRVQRASAAAPAQGMAAAIETISLAQAQVALAQGNTGNRPLAHGVVAKYARVMAAGQWDALNGEPIIFDTEGHILDGQHRLAASVRAEYPLTTLVVRGVNPLYRRSIDTGRRRTVSNVLAMQGEKNATVLASALRWLSTYEQDGILSSRGSIAQFDSLPAITMYLALHPRMREAALYGARMHRLINPSIGAFATYLFLQKDAGLTEQFVSGIADGVIDQETQQPLFALREKLIKERTSARHYDEPVIAVFVVRAWNALRSHRKLSIFKWHPASATEPFPKVL